MLPMLMVVEVSRRLAIVVLAMKYLPLVALAVLVGYAFGWQIPVVFSRSSDSCCTEVAERAIDRWLLERCGRSQNLEWQVSSGRSSAVSCSAASA